MKLIYTNLYASQVVKFITPSDSLFQKPDVEIRVYIHSGFPPNPTISDFKEDYQSLLYQSL